MQNAIAVRKTGLAAILRFDQVNDRKPDTNEDLQNFVLRLLKVGAVGDVVTDNHEAIVDGIVQLCIETFAMYVYCPSETGIRPVILYLSSERNFNRIKQTVLKAVRKSTEAMSSEKLKVNIYRYLFTFVFACTKIAMELNADSQLKPREDPSIDKLNPYTRNEEPPPYFNAIYELCKTERNNLDITVKQVNKDHTASVENTPVAPPTPTSTSKLQNARQFDYYNINDMVAEFDKLVNSVDGDAGICSQDGGCAVNEYDFLFGVVGSGDGDTKPLASDNENEDFFGKTKQRFVEASDANMTTKTDDVNVFSSCYGLLVLLAHRRLVHTLPGNCINFKRVFGEDVSETFLRFYHRHTKDYLENSLVKSYDDSAIATTRMNFESLGTMVASVVMDDYIERIDAKRNETLGDKLSDDIRVRVCKFLEGNATLVKNMSIRKTGEKNPYTEHFKNILNAAVTGEIEVGVLKDDQDNQWFSYKSNNTKLDVKSFLRKLNADIRGIKEQVKSQYGRANTQYFVDYKRNAYYDTYSNEMKMFVLTSRVFVDQYVYNNSRIKNSMFAIINEFENPEWKASSGSKISIKDGFDILAKNYLGANSGYDSISGNAEQRQVLFSRFPDLRKNLEFAFNNLRHDKPLFSGNFTKADFGTHLQMQEFDRTIKKQVGEVKLVETNAKELPANLSVADDSDFAFYRLLGNSVQYMSCGEGKDNCATATDIKYSPKSNEKSSKNAQPGASVSYASFDGLASSFQKSSKTVSFEKVFDVSKKNEVTNIANSLMMGYSATLQQGITMLSFGASGVGKTSLFFGRKNDGAPGLLNVIFSTMPTMYPFVENSHLSIALKVYEVYKSSSSSSSDLEYFVLKPGSTEKPKFNATDLNFGDGENQSFSLEKKKDKEEIGNCFEHDNINLLDDPSSHITDKLIRIDEFMTRKRKDERRIIPTVNNPESSRSAIVYKFEFSYSFKQDNVSKKTEENAPGEFSLSRSVSMKDTTTITVPISLVDLPGYEQLDPETYPSTAFIQSIIKNALDFLDDRTKTDFIDEMKLIEGTSQSAENMRVISFLVMNNKGNNVNKLNTIKAAVLDRFISGTSTGKNAMMLKEGVKKNSSELEKFGEEWASFLALKTALARSYFDLQKDQRLFLDMLRERTIQ